jgi:hypothetical protein
MSQIFPSNPDYSIGATGDDINAKLDSIIKQLNDHQRILNNAFEQYKSETWLQMHPQWTDSWTTNSTYTDIQGSLGTINFDDWTGHTWYFEMIGKTDAGTGYYRLYNITTDEPVENSEISTTSTTATRIRSDILPKPDGEHEFKIQHRIDGGNGTTEYVNSMMSRMVFRISS